MSSRPSMNGRTLPRSFSSLYPAPASSGALPQARTLPRSLSSEPGWSEGAQQSPTMSHHSDDNMLIASSDSFWEPNNYKRTTKRIEDGYKLCNELITLVQERSDIEKTYAKSLKSWSKKWNDLIEKGPEYGTTEAAWKGVLVEADRLCDLHLKVKDNLCNDVITQVKTWQKDSYHKSMITIKERKEMEDQFKKAQKPWSKLLQKVNKAKQDYHTACKTEKSAANQERNATGDSSLSPDQVKKMQDRVQKVKEDVLRGKEKYDLALQEINAHNPKYVEEMTEVFSKCQEMEAERLRFFKEVLFSMQKCLNISNDPVLPQIYDEFYHTVNNADYEKDLKWWSNNHGVNMAMNWPQFEDYTEELREIAKAKLKDTLPASSITLINQRPVSEDLHRWLGRKPKDSIILINQRPISEDELLHEFPPVNQRVPAKKPVSRVIPTDVNNEDRKTSPSAGHNSNSKTSTTPTSAANNDKTDGSNKTPTITNGTPRAEANPFEEEEWDEEGNEALVDNGEPGVPVRALYDYEGAESDELSFKQGELFEKLEDEDEQGWCKGRKDGRCGLYPANYVEVVSQ